MKWFDRLMAFVELNWPPRQTRIHEQSETDRIERERNQHEAVLSAINGITNQIHTAQQQQDTNEKSKASREWVSIVGLLITAGAAALGIVLNIVQIHRSHEALLLDQRAWVAPTDEHLLKTPYGSPYVGVDFKNTGKTFALKYSGWINYTFNLADIPDSDDKSKTTNSGTLAPNGSGSIAFAEHPMSPQIIPLIQSGSVPYVYGTIWYEDVFSTKQHWTQFCYALGSDLVTFSPCPDGKHTQTDDKQDQ